MLTRALRSNLLKYFLLAILITVICYFNIRLITSDLKMIKLVTLFILPLIIIYFFINFEHAWVLFTLVLILPFNLDISPIRSLNACSIIIPGLFVIFLIRSITVQEKGPWIRIIPKSIIIFFTLGFISFWRQPCFPTTLFGTTIEYGIFRNYWNFFVGFLTYFLAFHLFINGDKRLKIFIKLLFYTYVFSLIANVIMSILKLQTLPGFQPVAFGPIEEQGTVSLRSGALGRYGMNLFILLLVFKTYLRSKILKIFLFLFCIFAITASGARGTLVTVLAAALLYFILRKKFLNLIVPLSALTIILVVSYSAPHLINYLPCSFRRIFVIFPSPEVYGSERAVIAPGQGRLQWWRSGVQIISRHPFFGIGYVKVGREYLYQPFSQLAAQYGAIHNAYLAIAVMLGIPGLILLLWIFYLHLKRGIILVNETHDSFNKHFNLWLTIMAFSHNIIYFFGGSAHSLYYYFLYAGLINLNWYLLKNSHNQRSIN